MNPAADSGQKTFWQHFDDLRAVLLRSLAVVAAAAILAFALKEWLFDWLLWPTDNDFPLYRLLGWQAHKATGPTLVNTQLAGQMMVHLQTAAAAGLTVSFPYIIASFTAYLTPALYDRERRTLHAAALWGGLLFLLGLATAYFIVFPLAYQFLIDYSVSEHVANMITLTSYFDTLLCLCLLMGVLFELPVLFALLGRAGLVNAATMAHFRRHAILVILIIVAIVTPTTDIFTLLVCGLPIYLLYEVSLIVVRANEKR